MGTTDRPNFDVLLITALPDEYDHALAAVTPDAGSGGWHPIRDAGKVPMVWGEFASADGATFTVLVSRCSGMGEEATKDRIRTLAPDYGFRGVAMSGVCAGRQGKVRQGDVIACSVAWKTGPGKHSVSYHEDRAITKIEANVQYEDIIPDYWREDLLDFRRPFLSQFSNRIMQYYPAAGILPYKPSVHVGQLRTVPDVTLDEKAFLKANRLKRPTLGIEMEAFAIAREAKFHKYQFWLVAKGVQDFAKGQLGGSDKDSDDIYRPLAASASTLFVVEFLRIQIPLLSVVQKRFPEVGNTGNNQFDSTWLLQDESGQSLAEIRLVPAVPRYIDAQWIRRAFGTPGLVVTVNVYEAKNGATTRFNFVTAQGRNIVLPTPTIESGRLVVSEFHYQIGATMNSNHLDLYHTYIAQARIEVS